MCIQYSLVTTDHDASYYSVPASRYTFEQLAAIYNQTRVDYIVPMPMNSKRMEEYVRHYDVDLEASIVAFNSDEEMTGIGMLGLRAKRAWITRLGVLPARRGRKIGQYIMETLLQQACDNAAEQVQLEVIKGNEPAHMLFSKLGFEVQRELLVVRRPPRELDCPAPAADIVVENLAEAQIRERLKVRHGNPSWLDENASLLNIGSLEGLQITLPSGASGWIVFHNAMFQLSHFAFETEPEADNVLTEALLYYLHHQFPNRDTKVENLPADSPVWPIFEKLGYVEAFRRLEMTLVL